MNTSCEISEGARCCGRSKSWLEERDITRLPLASGRDLLGNKSLNVLVSDVLEEDSDAAALEELMAGGTRPRWLVVTANGVSAAIEGADLILAKVERLSKRISDSGH